MLIECKCMTRPGRVPGREAMFKIFAFRFVMAPLAALFSHLAWRMREPFCLRCADSLGRHLHRLGAGAEARPLHPNQRLQALPRGRHDPRRRVQVRRQLRNSDGAARPGIRRKSLTPRPPSASYAPTPPSTNSPRTSSPRSGPRPAATSPPCLALPASWPRWKALNSATPGS
jgi:hypothetical protein